MQLRKKVNLVKRTKFARKCKRHLQPDLEKFGMSIYIDSVGFEYKGNSLRNAKKPNKEPDINQSAKSKKEFKNQTKFHVAFHMTKKLFFANFSPVL